MKRVFLTLSALAVLLTGCGNEQISEGTVALELTGEVIDIGETSYFLGETISYENVTVVPLISQDYDPEQDADYITLAEATKNDWIEIIEKPGEEVYTELTVRYSGPKPLLLLAGELLLGGKQDRIVAKDTVIKPMSTVVVSVFCVEPGRWSGTSLSFNYPGVQVPMSVKEQAMLGSQDGVWAETKAYNDRAGSADRGRSTVDMGMKSDEVVKFTKEGKAQLLALRDTDRPVVGVVFIINGKIRSMEIFGAPRLFSSAYESILGGVLAEAAIDRSDDFDLPSAETLQAFLAKVSSAQSSAFMAGVPASGDPYLMGAAAGVSGAILFAEEEDAAEITHGTFYNKED
ncbi:MAG: hypothetical protein IH944_04990 [Armatimonadetes bacterium]|nr:hypothetical protein [Armatimonadota bacterium]